MNWVDRLLQRWRIRRAGSYVPKGARVLDIGCSDGALFEQLKDKIGDGCVGIDPELSVSVNEERYRLIRGQFPEDLPGPEQFDVITMIAVLEHVPRHKIENLAGNFLKFLKPSGRLIITLPSPKADRLLNLMKAAKIIDGMFLEQHYGLEPDDVHSVFVAHGFNLIKKEKFQLGFNNLIIMGRQHL